MHIPYARQSISQDDIDAVIATLHSDWLTQGPAVDRFEAAVTRYTGNRHAVAVCNATAALHLCCRAFNLGKGDLLWTTPNTFVASANCALYCGASVDFVDIDPVTYNLSLDSLKEKLTAAKKAKLLPKVVVPVAFGGQSCQMREIKDLSLEYGFKIIEDASHAIGGKYLNSPIGSGEFADLTVFSFHPVKIITTGEGGMILTRQPDLSEKIRLLRSHGITHDQKLMDTESPGAWYYQQVDLGYNYRITDIQAALGESQLKRIDEFVNRRQVIAKRYDEAFKNLPISTPIQTPENLSAFHLYVIRIKSSESRKNRSQVFDELKRNGIYPNVHYIPIHLQPYYAKMGFKPGDFPMAEKYYQEALSLPMYYGLKDSEQDHVIETVTKIFKEEVRR